MLNLRSLFFLHAFFLVLVRRKTFAFAPQEVVVATTITNRQWGIIASSRNHLHRLEKPLFVLEKMFEAEGPLGKGITVGKVSVSLFSPGHGKDSIFAMLEENSRWIADDDDAGSLADMAHEVCLSLLRREASWTAACGDSRWFSTKDYGKAESLYNEWANAEAAKFEKDYIPDVSHDSTEEEISKIVVVSLVIEIMGDNTTYVPLSLEDTPSLSFTQIALHFLFVSDLKAQDIVLQTPKRYYKASLAIVL